MFIATSRTGKWDGLGACSSMSTVRDWSGNADSYGGSLEAVSSYGAIKSGKAEGGGADITTDFDG